MTPLAMAAVFAGAGCGALLRWVFGLWLNPLFEALPLGTLAANLVGGLLVGLAVVYFARHGELAPAWGLFVITGFLGGLTTFSSFSAEVVAMIMRQQYAWAAGTAGLHLIGSLALTGAGIALAHALWGRA